MSNVPGVPSAEELSALPAAELATRLTEAYRLIAELTAQVGRLSAQVEDLERQSGPRGFVHVVAAADRSLRERGKRRPGQKPGEPGMTMNLVDDPDEQLQGHRVAFAGGRRSPRRSRCAE